MSIRHRDTQEVVFRFKVNLTTRELEMFPLILLLSLLLFCYFFLSTLKAKETLQRTTFFGHYNVFKCCIVGVSAGKNSIFYLVMLGIAIKQDLHDGISLAVFMTPLYWCHSISEVLAGLLSLHSCSFLHIRRQNSLSFSVL